MDKFGLVTLLFVVVPGFLADQVFTVCWGAKTGSDSERAVRSVIWSVLGLAVYLWWFKSPPPYIAQHVSQLDSASLDATSLESIAVHTGFASALALIAGGLVSHRLAQRLISGLFHRPILESTAWDMMWRHHREGRTVRVRTKDGKIIFGWCLSVSGSESDKDIVLSDPKIVDQDSTIVDPLSDVRLIFIPQEQIEEVRLGFTEKERENVERKRLRTSEAKEPSASGS